MHTLGTYLITAALAPTFVLLPIWILTITFAPTFITTLSPNVGQSVGLDLPIVT